MSTYLSKQDEDAFRAYYRAYQPYVQALCRKRVMQTEQRRDLEAVVWLDVASAPETFLIDDPRALLYQLVSWRANDLYRSLYRRNELDLEDELLSRMLEQKLSTQPRSEEHLDLQRLVDKEPLLHRQLLFGRFVEGLTHGELATRHQLHRNTIATRLKESLQRLHKRLGLGQKAKA